MEILKKEPRAIFSAESQPSVNQRQNKVSLTDSSPVYNSLPNPRSLRASFYIVLSHKDLLVLFGLKKTSHCLSCREKPCGYYFFWFVCTWFYKNAPKPAPSTLWGFPQSRIHAWKSPLLLCACSWKRVLLQKGPFFQQPKEIFLDIAKLSVKESITTFHSLKKMIT